MEKATVGVDGRPASRAALEWAVDRSRHVAMRVDLVAVASTQGVDGEFLDTVRRYHEGNLREWAEWAATAAPDLHVTTRLVLGHPTEELVRASEDADLLVIGTDKSSRVRQLVYGTVPLRLAALAASPLVVVPKSWRAGAGRVLIAVGDDPRPSAATEFAAREAEALRTELKVVHVWSAPSNYPSPLSLADYPWEQVAASEGRLVADAVARIRARHPSLSLRGQLQEGPTIPLLVDSAADAQLLVVGRGGRGLLRDMMHLGSVAHDLLLNPPAPIAIVPTQPALPDATELEDTVPVASVP